MAGQLDEASKQILATLLADFTESDRSAEDLKRGYEGPKIELLATAVCNADDITKVDFEIAFGEMEKKKLIKTGPMAVYDNPPGSVAIIFGVYSKREYVGLTAEGYKEARKTPNKPSSRVQRIVNNIHISGGEITNLQLAAGENVSQKMTVSLEESSTVVSKLVSMLESYGQQSTPEKLEQIEHAVEQANQGNAGESKNLLSKAFGTVWDKANAAAWPLIAELVKRSMGF